MNLRNARLQKGVLYHENFMGILEFGETIEKQSPPDGLYVLDCGTNKKVPVEADIIIYVTSGAPWQQDDEMPDWIDDDRVYVISNFSNRLESIRLAKELKKKVYRYPTVGGLEISKDEEKLFSAIFKNGKDSIIR